MLIDNFVQATHVVFKSIVDGVNSYAVGAEVACNNRISSVL